MPGESPGVLCRILGGRWADHLATVGPATHPGPSPCESAVAQADRSWRFRRSETLRYRRGVRSRLAITATVAALVAVLLAPTSAVGQTPGGPPPTPEPPTTRVVGGDPVAPGQFPWLAALHIGSTFECGATVVAPTWVLTAAHCVVNSSGQLIAPSSAQIRLNSVLRNSGGEVRRVASIHRHPGHPGAGRENDVALLRLTSPTTAPAVEVASPGMTALDAPDTPATTIGWGSTTEGGSQPTHARFASIQVLADDLCTAAYPEGSSLLFRTASQICAGHPLGGRDACQGDSGGPLVVHHEGRWVQTGVVSWGRGCARATDPGVYHQLTSSSDWISRTRRFGPFDPDGRSFITRQYLDFQGRNPSTADRTRWTSILTSERPAHMVATHALSNTWTTRTATVARVYKTALDRYPTTHEFSAWHDARANGTPLVHVAAFPANHLSHLSDLEFVRTLYRNALGGSNGNDALWVSRLRNRSYTRAEMIAHFAQTTTARARMSPDVRVNIIWFGALRRAPTAANVAQHRNRPLDEVAHHLIHTQSYGNRFR